MLSYVVFKQILIVASLQLGHHVNDSVTVTVTIRVTY